MAAFFIGENLMKKKFFAAMAYFWSTFTFALSTVQSVDAFDFTIDEWALVVSIVATILTALVNWLYQHRNFELLKKKYQRWAQHEDHQDD